MTTYPFSAACAPTTCSQSVYTDLFTIKETRPGLYPLAKTVFNATARLITNCNLHIGCGILVGIDRFLLPLHVIAGRCLDEVKICFEVCAETCSYTFTARPLHILALSRDFDFCLLHLSPTSLSSDRPLLPGHICRIPPFSGEDHSLTTLAVHVDSLGSKTITIANSCSRTSPESYCSLHPTVPSSSGGPLFSLRGIIAMHLARSTGLCSRPDTERSSLLIKEIWNRCHLMRLPPCLSICPSSLARRCLPPLPPRTDFCYADEKGKAALNGTFTAPSGLICKYWETFPSNSSGPGPRGIRITISPGARTSAVLDLTFRFNENPHDCRAYSKNPEKLYKAAALALLSKYVPGKLTIDPPSFTAFGEIFTLRPD